MQLNKFLVLSMVGLKESGFDMWSALMISLEDGPDLPSRLKVLHMVKIQEARE
jgi:hypothetical protein